MGILAKGEFDINALRAQRAKQTAKKGMSNADGLRQISPDIEKLKVGETAQIKVAKDEKIRSVVMSISAKLSWLTCKDGEWAPKQYEVVSDPSTGTVYVQRGHNAKPHELKERVAAGGRKTMTDEEKAAAAEKRAKKKAAKEAAAAALAANPDANTGEQENDTTEETNDESETNTETMTESQGAIITEHA